jgi:hypothetical protein
MPTPSFMIEMTRDSAEPGGRDRYSLSSDAWTQLLVLGTTFGWQQRGTRYQRKQTDKVADVSATADAVHDYLPGNHLDYKRVDAEDAYAWATALSAASSPHMEAAVCDTADTIVLRGTPSTEATQSVNAPFAVTMTEFIEYAYGGAFSFARAK